MGSASQCLLKFGFDSTYSKRHQNLHRIARTDENHWRYNWICEETLQASSSDNLKAGTDISEGQNSGASPERLSLRYRCVWRVGYFFRLRLQQQLGWAWRWAMAALAWIIRL